MENSNWTDQDEIHAYMNNAAEMNKVFFKLTDMITKHDNRVGKLPPMGIYYNNKMVEIYHYFQNKNVPYAFSKVNRTINSYFIILMKEAISILNDYIDCNNSLLSTSDIEITENMKKDLLNKYKNLCDKVLNFSIEKDAPKVIYNYFDGKNDIEKHNKYKEELEQLGIIYIEDDTTNKKAH